MLSNQFINNLRIVPFLVLPCLVWLYSSITEEFHGDFSTEKINLALRRTADALLRQSGDSTSRIPAIEQSENGIWRIRLEQSFQYEQLPALLQSSFELHNIRQPYEVAVRRCEDAVIDLGYHQFDFLYTNKVPCMGREMPKACHYIEIIFLEASGKKSFWTAKSGIMFLILVGLLGFWLLRRQKTMSVVPLANTGTECLEFGNSQLDVAGQLLIYGQVRQPLTFRETKLLRLFASSPNRLLERDFILHQVWADEGVLVGRSIDVFVSRLRKKLAVDSSVGIVAVHGVGYRLETGK